MTIFPAAQNPFAPPANPILDAFRAFRGRVQQPPAVSEAGPGMTPDQIAAQRKVAEALLERGTSTEGIGHWTQGVARVMDAMSGARKERLAGEAETANSAERQRLLDALGGVGAGALGGFPSMGASGPMDAGAPGISVIPGAAPSLGQSAEPPTDFRLPEGGAQSAIREGIASTAAALGIDPIDLATAISYETGGTFDPTKAGPTTKWGQHRGLIQFGEPQAQQYGVNWDDPVGSQLGPDGAVARYLRDTGVQPGMGLLDIYSAINAGGVGRYNRSDAAAGGAPGTVRDKVEQQMAGHRARAEAMFGGSGGGSAGGNIPALMAAATSPVMDEPTRRIVGALLQQEMQQQQQANDPMRAMQLERAQLELEALRNPSQPATVQALSWRAQEAGLVPGTPEYQQFMIANGGGQGDGPSRVQSSDILDDGTIITVMSDGSPRVTSPSGEVLTGQAAADAIIQAREYGVENQRSIYGGRREGTLGADIDLGGQAQGVKDVASATVAQGISAWEDYGKLQSSLGNIDEALAALDRGAESGLVYNMLPSVTEASASLENAMNRMGLDVIGSVTFGALSEGEMRLAMDTAVPRNLAPAELRTWLARKRDAQQKAAEMLADAARYMTVPGNTINGWIERNMARAGVSPDGRTAPRMPSPTGERPTSRAEYDLLPSGAEFIAPDGSRRRKP